MNTAITGVSSLQSFLTYDLSGETLIVKKLPSLKEDCRILLYCNGVYLEDLSFEDGLSKKKLVKKGRYNLQIRKKINDENVIKNSEYFDYVHMNVDVCCGIRNNQILEGIEDISIAHKFNPSEVSLELKLYQDDTVLILDFDSEINSYSINNPNRISGYITNENLSPSGDSELKDMELEEFRLRIKSSLNDAVQIYGTGNVIVLLNLRGEKFFDWMMEEVFFITMQNKNVVHTGLIKSNEKSDEIIREKIKEVADRKFISYPKIQKIDVSIEGCKLNAECWMNSLDSFWCRFDLIKDGKRITTEYKPKDNKHSWELKDSGIYSVEVHMSYLDMRTHRRSKCIEFFTESFNNEYTTFLSKKTKKIEKIPLRENKHPYFDFALISSEKIDFDFIKDVPPKLFLKKIANVGKFKNLLISNYQSAIENEILFSGFLISDDEEISISHQPGERLGTIKNRRGSYAFLYSDSAHIYVSRDFFNLCEIYYYANDNITIISNNYHLLLLTLNATGTCVSVNIEKACALLSMPRTQILMQNFSSSMDMNGVYMLPPYYDLELTDDGWRRVKNEFYQILKKKEPYHEILYRKMIEDGSLELKKRLANICKYSEERIVVDLTGGIDSRIVYGALGEDCGSNITINSQKGIGKQEVEIATTLNSLLYRLPYDTSPGPTCEMDSLDANRWMRSNNMGRTYEFKLNVAYKYPEQQISVNGAFGEVLTRPEYGNHCFDITNEELSLETVLDSYLSKIRHNIITDDSASQYIFKILFEEMNNFPTESPYKKLECHYLSFRHARHFDVITENLRRNFLLTPMQSITLFRAHQMTYDVFKNMKIAFDILGELDIRLLSIPYEHEKYNLDYEKLRPKLIHDTDFIENFDTKIDVSEWKIAQEIKEKNRKELKEKNGRTFELSPVKYSEFDKYIDVESKNNLALLLNLVPELEKKVGRALYHYLQNVCEKKADLYAMYNKITSLLDQVIIFEYEKLESQFEENKKCILKTDNLSKSDMFELAKMLSEHDDIDDLTKAFEIYLMLSKENNTGAIGRLARAYRDGKGTEKNLDEAIKLMRNASENNVGWAKLELTDMLLARGSDADKTEAFAVCNELAATGNPGACGRLGRMYRDGCGVAVDLEKAKSLMKKAADMGVEWAVAEYSEMTKKQ